MKARVEAGDLRHAGQPLGDRVDRREIVRLVERSERYQLAQFVETCGVTIVGPAKRAPPWTTRWPTPSTRAPP